MIEISILFLFVLGFAFFLVWWAHEAERDRSAMVGLYLILGAPGFLLFVAGLAVSVRRGLEDLGPILLLAGAGLLLPFLRPVRVSLAKLGDFGPDDPVHFLGLGIFLGAVGYFGGQLVAEPEPREIASFDPGPIILLGVFLTSLAFVAAGYKIDRTLSDAMRRLGLVRPSVAGTLAAGGVVLAGFILSAVGSELTRLTNETYARDIQDSLEVLTTSSPSYLVAPLIGLSAGIGEELLFRGALQPRYGILMSSLLFALLHSQYGFSFITLSTFLLGCILGLLAKRYGVIHAIIAHTLYNMLAVIISASAG